MMRQVLAGLAMLGTLWLAAPAAAHELRPAYLELSAADDHAWDATWKVPVRQGRPLAVEPRFPDGCTVAGAPARSQDNAALVVRFRIACTQPLEGRALHFDGLDGTLTDVLVRIAGPDGTSTARATPDAPAVTLPARPSAQGAAWTYFVLGVEHILLGIDHLLFVLALVLLITGFRRLVETVTAFTVAHSLTLAGVTLGWVSLPSAPVEAVIALSIVFLAREVVLKLEAPPGTPARLAERRPWLVAFAFGLLHGFGFAGALAEIGLPQDAVLLALFTFNLGVEAGQIAFVAVALSALWLLRRVNFRRAAEIPATYLIGIVASFWLIERTF